MSDKEKPAVNDEAKRKLAELFYKLARSPVSTWEDVYSDREDLASALEIVDEIIEAGWSPNNE